MPWPIIAAAGASLLGGWLGNRARASEAQKNRDFQASQSSTAWQRGVKDMEAAGLNPALAYGQGPASSGSGSMAQQSDVVGPAVNSAMAMQRQKAEVQLIRDQSSATRHAGQKSAAEAQHQFVTTQRMYGDPGSPDKKQRDGYYDRMQRALIEAQRLLLPGLRNSARAHEKMPAAAYLRLLTGAGGGPLTGAISRIGR